MAYAFSPSQWINQSQLTLYNDGSPVSGPGFIQYYNSMDPPTPDLCSSDPTPPCTSIIVYSEGLLPRYTYVADGLVVVEGNGGDVYAFKYSGAVNTPSPSPSLVPQPTPSPSSQPSPSPDCAGVLDVNCDRAVDTQDLKTVINNYLTLGSGIIEDINQDLKVNTLDASWIINALLPDTSPTPTPSSSPGSGAMGPLAVHPTNNRYFAKPDGSAVFLTGSHTWDNRQDLGTGNFNWMG